MGMPVISWDNAVLVFREELISSQMTTVQWNIAVFIPTLADDIVVGVDAPVKERLVLNPNIQMLYIYVDEDARVRRKVYLSRTIVQLILEMEVTLRQGSKKLGGTVRSVGKKVKCKPILNWIKVALTRGVANRSSSLASSDPLALLADRGLV